MDDIRPLHQFRPLIYRSTLVVFLLVVAVHVVIAWWMLGVTFRRVPAPEDEPIFVMVIADGVGESGGEPSADAGAAAQAADDNTSARAGGDNAKLPEAGEPADQAAADASPKALTPAAQQEPDTSGVAPVAPTPAQSALEAPEPSAAVAVDKAVDKSVNKPVDNARQAPQAVATRPATASREPASRTSAAPAKNTLQTTADSTAVPIQVTAQTGADDARTGSAASAAAGGARTGSAASAAASGAITGPRRISKPDYLDGPPALTYPQSARSRRQQGKVVVRVVISAAGQASAVDILQTSGVDSLDRAALDAVRRARFRPYAENGIALDALVDIPFDFVLRN